MTQGVAKAGGIKLDKQVTDDKTQALHPTYLHLSSGVAVLYPVQVTGGTPDIQSGPEGLPNRDSERTVAGGRGEQFQG